VEFTTDVGIRHGVGYTLVNEKMGYLRNVFVDFGVSSSKCLVDIKEHM